MVAANCIMFACSRLIYRCAGVFVGMRSILLGFSLDSRMSLMDSMSQNVSDGLHVSECL